jgi:hypothetical protein
MKITKMKNPLAILFAILLLMMGTQMAFAALHDDFNLENGGVGVLNYNNFANWTVSNGTVDLIGNGFFDFYPGNGLYVDLDGSTNQPGLFSSKTTFAPGTYVVSFNLGDSYYNNPDYNYPPNTVTIQMGMGDFNVDITRNSSNNLDLFTYNVTTSQAGPLTFQNDGNDNVGAILDNVTVSAVPEPISLLLFGLGLVGLAGVRRKFKK